MILPHLKNYFGGSFFLSGSGEASWEMILRIESVPFKKYGIKMGESAHQIVK